jgi:hypothetical protein
MNFSSYLNDTARAYVQYYGMNASDFFSRKITWDECRMQCVYESFNRSYAGVYWIIIPAAVMTIACFGYFIMRSYDSSLDEKQIAVCNLSIFWLMVLLFVLAVFLSWFVWQVSLAKGLI